MLLDTNVLVAAAIPTHAHHADSHALIEAAPSPSIAGHSLIEFVSTVTRLGRYEWSGEAAAQQVHKFASFMRVVALVPQDITSLASHFARAGGRGPLIYDYFIGRHAEVHELGTIVTWNAKDFRPLFPRLGIFTPSQYLETL